MSERNRRDAHWHWVSEGKPQDALFIAREAERVRDAKERAKANGFEVLTRGNGKVVPSYN